MKVLFLFFALIGSASAGSVWLVAPPYPWGAGQTHSNVTHVFATGFDASGNPTGICTYYSQSGKYGFPVYATCGWDLTGKPLYVIPMITAPVFQLTNPTDVDSVLLPDGSQANGFDQGNNGAGFWVYLFFYAYRSILVTP